MTDSPAISNGSGIDTTVAHPARRYDYLLGGKDNFEADRRSAETLLKLFPTAKKAALENRACLRRMVRWLAQQGISQFLDIGTGIPTSPNTHEVARAENPQARVAYVDNDPLVLAHARALMDPLSNGRTAFVQADLRNPEQILTDPNVRAVLDMSQPIALCAIAVLHFVGDPDNEADDEPIRAPLRSLINALPQGSYLALTHGTYDPLTPTQLAPITTELGRKTEHGAIYPRSKDRLTALLDDLDLELTDPGIVSIIQWRPYLERPPSPTVTEAEVCCWAAVARKP